ncbi:hypothetical protein NODU109028_16360 [Nocardioides dubius]|uniref:4 TMS phage holin, superfamily IV n=1 Tax=Nocardioides dubius TaxID=317019 RepID=A0ABN1U121_9ACTN
MIRMLIRAAVFFASAALGILVASWVLDDVRIQVSGFLAVVVIYSVIQLVISPFVMKMAARHAAAFLGGSGLVATFLALLVAVAWGDALSISGVGTWIAATVVVWLTTALATLALPFLLVKAGVQAAANRAETR